MSAANSLATAPATNVRYVMLGLFCAAATVAYVQRYSINLLADPLGRELRLDKDQLGLVMSAFFFTYSLLSLPAGWLGDRCGSRRVLTIYAVTWSVATAVMATAGGLIELIVIWSLMGVAQAGLFPCAVIGVRQWLPPTRRAFASGMLSSFMSAGGVLSPLLAGGLLDPLGYTWREVFLWLAAPGLLWAGIFWFWYRDRPAEHPWVNDAERALIAVDLDGTERAPNPATPLPRVPWRRLALSWRMWLICGQHFYRSGAQVFFGTWFATFLIETPGISGEDVKFLSSLPPGVLIVGALLGGVVSDALLRRTGSRRVSRQWLAVVCMLLCAASFVAAALVVDAYIRVGLICVGCFWMALGGVSSYTITMDMGGPYVATVFSTMNMCGSLGATAFPAYVGWLLKVTRLPDELPNWNYVLYSIAAIYVAAAVCWAGLNPNGTLFDPPSQNALR